MTGKIAYSKKVKIENIVESGFNINIDQLSIFVSFAIFDIFKEVKVADLFDVEYCSDDSLHWGKADIDIDIDAFLHPQNYQKRFPAYPKQKALAKELIKIAEELEKSI